MSSAKLAAALITLIAFAMCTGALIYIYYAGIDTSPATQVGILLCALVVILWFGVILTNNDDIGEGKKVS